MITAIIILSVLLSGTILFLISAIMHILKIQKELISISDEQHTQNMDIIRVMKELAKTQNFLLEQFKVNEEVAKAIQYLADKDLIKDIQNMDPNKIGKA